MDAYRPGFGRMAVIVLAGLVLIGDLFFALKMMADVSG
jgi:hypothetical protein